MPYADREMDTSRDRSLLSKLLEVECTEEFGRKIARIIAFNLDDAFTAGDFNWVNEVFKTPYFQKLSPTIQYHLFGFSRVAYDQLPDRIHALQKSIVDLKWAVERFEKWELTDKN